MRVGILGGAFNPPHIGHLVCAQESLVQLELDKVVFIPVGQAPHRELEATRAPRSGSRWSSWRPPTTSASRSRAWRSTGRARRTRPTRCAGCARRRREDELFLILGGDQAAALASWHEPEEVLALATVAVMERLSWSRQAIGIKLGGLRGRAA